VAPVAWKCLKQELGERSRQAEQEGESACGVQFTAGPVTRAFICPVTGGEDPQYARCPIAQTIDDEVAVECPNCPKREIRSDRRWR
jgi:hypothetical protein